MNDCIYFHEELAACIDDTKELTRVGTAPGFWTRSALTTWKTSTTPSVLHRSMMVAMAQNIPLLVTVSLEKIAVQKECSLLTYTLDKHLLVYQLSNVCCDNETPLLRITVTQWLYYTQWSSQK